MLYLFLSLVFVGAFAALLGWYSYRKEGETPIIQSTSDCATCSGENQKCEQECQLEAAVNPIVYFEDEELDRFKGRASDGYASEEVAEFAEVLYTMRADEVADWCRSLTLRGVSLPDELKDEVLLLING